MLFDRSWYNRSGVERVMGFATPDEVEQFFHDVPEFERMLVDDGVRGRGHRKNIFNPIYNVAGAAYGSHARFGSVCSIDFASGYAENRLVRAGSDAQNSF